MASFEAIAEAALPILCPDCPIRNICAQVEMARLEAESEGLDGENLGAMEAEAAAKLVFTSVFKNRAGCEGPIAHDQTCDCGNDRGCGAFTVAYQIADNEG